MTDKFEVTEPLELKINILSLSDEVLVHICSFLASTDLVSLSSTCKRMNSILCERKLVRNVDLTAPYSLTPVDLRSFFLPLVRSKNIDTISLTSCYWLTSSDLLWIILRLTNLRSLHVNDTNLSIEHLARILKNIKSIENLSWTFHMTKKIGKGNLKELSEHLYILKSLNLWTKGFALCFLPMLLKKCSSLEALKLTTYKFRDVPWDRTKLLDSSVNLNFPNLRTFILDVCENINGSLFDFFAHLFEACTQDRQWKKLWFDSRFDVPSVTGDLIRHLEIQKEIEAISLSVPWDHLRSFLELKSLKFMKCSEQSGEFNYELFDNSKITHLLWKNEYLPKYLPSTLQHLWMSCNVMRHNLPEDIVQYEILPHLKSLSVPVCLMLLHNSDQCSPSLLQEEETFQKKSDRKSHFGKTAIRNCLLRVFTDVAPNVRELEMKCKRGCTDLQQDAFASLVLISRWIELETLFLECIPMVDMSLLVMICSSCPKLRRLGLKRVGIAAGFSQTWNIAQAINVLKNLEDFQFEQPAVDKLTSIVEALSGCPKLRRVSIISERTTAPQNLHSYLNLVEKCSDLVFLFVRVASISQKMEKDFHKELKSKFLNKRKCLWASLQGTERDDFWECIPSIHCYEMIFDPALLTIIPPL